jgi:hypothetical protein
MTFEIVIAKKANKTFGAIRSQIFNKWGERGEPFDKSKFKNFLFELHVTEKAPIKVYKVY